jgi:outer membrane protein insertion porin family
LALRVEGVNIDDVDLFTSSEIRDDEGGNMMTSLKGTLVRDRTDSRFIPSSGDRLRLSYEQVGILGGDHVFGKLIAAYSWFKTMRTDALERKSVLHLRGEGGVIVGNAPVFERFFAGGTGSIRGFEFRGVGEHDGIDDNNIGGDYLALFGAEYSFPVYGDNLRGHVFLDSGTAGSGTLRASVGVGVRLTVDLLGPLPLEFNLALPVSSESEDDEQVFSFLIGTLF